MQNLGNDDERKLGKKRRVVGRNVAINRARLPRFFTPNIAGRMSDWFNQLVVDSSS